MDKRYAPIVIPTLNRYNHFKACVESLSRCKLAEKTELFIGLDYPPSEKYVEGYELIKGYIPSITGFKTVVVLETDKNLGVNPNCNRLYRHIRELGYENYIFTEDDNEFAPGFLEFVNWGLETYREDDSIYAVCGFKRVPTESLKNNVYKYPRFNGWGFGQWFDKREKVEKYRDLDQLRLILNEMSIFSAFTTELSKATAIIGMLIENTIHGDFMPSFLPIEEQFCLFPATSMVKNQGQDGSGIHGGSKRTVDLYNSVSIDTNKGFVPYIVEDLYSPNLKEIYQAAYRVPLSTKIKSAFTFVLYKTTGRILDHKYKDPWYKMRLRKI